MAQLRHTQRGVYPVPSFITNFRLSIGSKALRKLQRSLKLKLLILSNFNRIRPTHRSLIKICGTNKETLAFQLDLHLLAHRMLHQCKGCKDHRLKVVILLVIQCMVTLNSLSLVHLKFNPLL